MRSRSPSPGEQTRRRHRVKHRREVRARIHSDLRPSPKIQTKLSREQVLGRIAESVSYAKQHAQIVEFSAEDATRTEIGFLKEAYKTAERSSTDRA